MVRINKRVIITVLILVLLAGLAGCGKSADTQAEISGGNVGNVVDGYEQITAEEAKVIMDSDENYVILDVRTQEEYDEGHIPGAVLIPDYEITEKAEAKLPDKDQVILVYCRSGNRSKSASAELAQMGYTNVKEFGGIIDWPYETEKTLSYRPCNKPGDEKYEQE